MVDEAAIQADYWRAWMYSELAEQLQSITPTGRGIEFGGSNGIIQSVCPGVNWETRYYPPYDVCDPASWDGEWDWVAMDMILEHTKRPWEVFEIMGRTVANAIITVPFLIGIHYCPDDYWRMTPSAIRELASPHYSKVDIRTWGNGDVAWLHAQYNDTATMMSQESEARWRSAAESNDPAKPFNIWAVLQR